MGKGKGRKGRKGGRKRERDDEMMWVKGGERKGKGFRAECSR